MNIGRDNTLLGMKTTIILIRHGESLANAVGVYLGHTDWDLSERGAQQAQVVAEYLADRQIDRIFSSDLIRAYNTALPHGVRHGLAVERRVALREIYLGDWEGRPVAELDSEYPEQFSVGWRKCFGTCKVPGGESVPELAERIYRELCTIGEECRGMTVLVATHAAAIRALWGKATGTAPEEVADAIPFPRNASITTLTYENGRLTPVEYGFDEYFGK